MSKPSDVCSQCGGLGECEQFNIGLEDDLWFKGSEFVGFGPCTACNGKGLAHGREHKEKLKAIQDAQKRIDPNKVLDEIIRKLECGEL